MNKENTGSKGPDLMRVKHCGDVTAFQAEETGSIPVTRSTKIEMSDNRTIDSAHSSCSSIMQVDSFRIP